MAIAVPGVMAISKRLKERGLESKKDAISEAAVVYAQENSNKIKAKLGTCTEPNDHCECDRRDENGNYTDCKYYFTITVDDLIRVSAYKTEKSGKDTAVCDVTDPRDSSLCLDCVPILVKLDDDYKNATAEIKTEDIKDGKTVCEKSSIVN